MWHTASGTLVEEQWLSSTSYTTETLLKENEDYHWEVDAWDAAGHHVGTTEEPARFLVPVLVARASPSAFPGQGGVGGGAVFGRTLGAQLAVED